MYFCKRQIEVKTKVINQLQKCGGGLKPHPLRSPLFHISLTLIQPAPAELLPTTASASESSNICIQKCIMSKFEALEIKTKILSSETFHRWKKVSISSSDHHNKIVITIKWNRNPLPPSPKSRMKLRNWSKGAKFTWFKVRVVIFFFYFVQDVVVVPVKSAIIHDRLACPKNWRQKESPHSSEQDITQIHVPNTPTPPSRLHYDPKT